MRLMGFLLLFTLLSCQEERFGYRNNPVAVLNKIHKAVSNEKLEVFTELLSRHALCEWGNNDGLKLLKKGLPDKVRYINPEVELLSSVIFDAPKFVGFWSYQRDTYYIKLIESSTRELIAEAKVECNFGNEGVAQPVDINYNKLDHTIKECKVSVIQANSFHHPTSISKLCDVFNNSLN